MSEWKFELPYEIDQKYSKKVAYFSMEFAIDQALKIYSGGLGFLSGSHMRSAFELKQNMVGIGVLWKNGYYNQVRKEDKTMSVLFLEKIYWFLEDTGIKFQLDINRHPVMVKAYYLPPNTFNSAPLFLLSTDLPENDYLAQTITHRLYDSNISTRIAQYTLLGVGGFKLMELLNMNPDIYHLNEAHGLPMAFKLFEKFKNIDKVRDHFVFTTHTPEKAGNEEHNLDYLHQMGFFGGLSPDEVRELLNFKESIFGLTEAALKLAKVSNAVSRKHGEVSREMWEHVDGCEIKSITNAQNKKYWADQRLYDALEGSTEEVLARKYSLKRKFFKEVADQSGKLFDPEVLTIVWARRFAEYKRPDLIVRFFERFKELINRTEHPIQLIWAGKPFPVDHGAISTFDNLVNLSKGFKNCTILVGYELELSKYCKRGADIWLNNPRVPREASGTSGMTAAMNGAINMSTEDGWMLEFARDGHNSFMIPLADPTLPIHEQDDLDATNLLDILEKKVIPTYYQDKDKWVQMMRNSMTEVLEGFESGRMAHEYYDLYNT